MCVGTRSYHLDVANESDYYHLQTHGQSSAASLVELIRRRPREEARGHRRAAPSPPAGPIVLILAYVPAMQTCEVRVG